MPRKAGGGERRSPSRPWTAGDDARLRAFVAEGVRYAEVGRQMGRTASAIKHRASKLKIRPRRAVPAKNEDCRQYYRPGVNARVTHYADQVAAALARAGRGEPAGAVEYVPYADEEAA